MKTSDGPYKSDDTVKVVSLCPRSDLDLPTADQWQLKNWLWRKEGEYGADAWTATHGAALRLRVVISGLTDRNTTHGENNSQSV